MEEQLLKRINDILDRDVKGEKVVDTVRDLCDLIDELNAANTLLHRKNSMILTRVVRAKLELDEVIA